LLVAQYAYYAAYLDSTTQYRIFGDLWTVRACLLPKPALPPLKARHFYAFKTEKDLAASHDGTAESATPTIQNSLISSFQ
jgi:hypothetical protein